SKIPITSVVNSGRVYFLASFFLRPNIHHKVAAPTSVHKISLSEEGILPVSGTNLKASPLLSLSPCQSPSNLPSCFSLSFLIALRFDISDCKCSFVWSEPPPGGAG